MTFGWFDHNWPWIGLAISAVLLTLLLTTNVFRSERKVSRWRDPVWLAWLAPAAYMLHQTEEYGITLFGRMFAFPDALCTTLGLPAYPGCTIPPALFAAVNVPLIWIAGLICALLSRRHPLIGLGLYGVFPANAISHIGSFVKTGHYNPGLLTAFLIQVPFAIWVGYAMAGDRRIGKSGVAVLFATGVALHAVLLGSLIAFTRGLIKAGAVVAIQVVNPAWCFILPWLKERYDARKASA
jgi:Protein of unknown function with HXXEE motif